MSTVWEPVDRFLPAYRAAQAAGTPPPEPSAAGNFMALFEYVRRMQKPAQ